MASRVAKARIPSEAGKRIIFSEDQWSLIEKAYGEKLPKPARTYVLLATETLRLVRSVELNAPELREVIVGTENLRDAARSLLKKCRCPIQEETLWTSFEAMTKDTARLVKEFSSDHLQFLMVVNCLLEGCNLMLRNWDSDGGLREGKMWDAWVQGISERMQYQGLPHAARKDSDKRDSNKVNSQFVLLIDELQKHIPENLRRHTQSKNALAQAIYRARKSKWWPELIPANINEERASLVEFLEAELASLGEQEERQDEQKEAKPRGG